MESCPKEFKQLIEDCLQEDPKKRPSAQKAYSRLNQLLSVATSKEYKIDPMLLDTRKNKDNYSLLEETEFEIESDFNPTKKKWSLVSFFSCLESSKPPSKTVPKKPPQHTSLCLKF